MLIRDAALGLQGRVANWVASTFSQSILMDRRERALRLLEEATELAQSLEVSESQCAALTRRVYSRPVGDPVAEAAGVTVCLLALHHMLGENFIQGFQVEMSRIESPEIRDKCRAKFFEKQAAGVNGDTKL